MFQGNLVGVVICLVNIAIGLELLQGPGLLKICIGAGALVVGVIIAVILLLKMFKK